MTICQCQFYSCSSGCLPDQSIMEEASVLQPAAVEGSRTTLDESVMPPPSSQRGIKRKSKDTEPDLPVSTDVSSGEVSVHNWFHPVNLICCSVLTPPPHTLHHLCSLLSSPDGSFGRAAAAAGDTVQCGLAPRGHHHEHQPADRVGPARWQEEERGRLWGRGQLEIQKNL